MKKGLCFFLLTFFCLFLLTLPALAAGEASVFAETTAETTANRKKTQIVKPSRPQTEEEPAETTPAEVNDGNASSFSDFIEKAFNSAVKTEDYGIAIWLTLKITFISTLISYLFGIPLGVLLYGTAADSIFPNKPINSILGVVVNIIRSVPFIILLVMTQPIAKGIVGSKLGDNAFIVYLVIAATPFIARMVESSLREVDQGVIEAAQSMGSTKWQIISKVLLPEAKPSLLVGSAIAITTILGYTPMTYLVSGGGLGQIAIQNGLYRFNSPVMYISSLLLIILVQIMQVLLSTIAKKCDKRIRGK